MVSFVGSFSGAHASTAAQAVSFSSLVDTLGGQPSLQPNDLVIITVFQATASANGTRTQAQLLPAGYTAAHASVVTGLDTNNSSMQASYKFMGATPDTTVSIPASRSTTEGVAYTIHVFRGVEITGPMDVTATRASGTNSAQPNPPAITPSRSGAWIYVAGGGAMAAGAAPQAAAPTGLETATNAWRTGLITSTTNDAGLAAGFKDDWVSGAFDCPAFTGFTTTNTGSWCAVTLALRPVIALSPEDSSCATTSDAPTIAPRTTMVPAASTAATTAQNATVSPVAAAALAPAASVAATASGGGQDVAFNAARSSATWIVSNGGRTVAMPANSGANLPAIWNQARSFAYFEVAVDAMPAGKFDCVIGLCNSTYTNYYPGGDANSVGVYSTGGVYKGNFGTSISASATSVGQVYGCLIKDGYAYFCNSTDTAYGWMGATTNADPTANTGGIPLATIGSALFPVVATANAAGGEQFTLNFTGPFTLAPAIALSPPAWSEPAGSTTLLFQRALQLQPLSSFLNLTMSGKNMKLDPALSASTLTMTGALNMTLQGSASAAGYQYAVADTVLTSNRSVQVEFTIVDAPDWDDTNRFIFVGDYRSAVSMSAIDYSAESGLIGNPETGVYTLTFGTTLLGIWRDGALLGDFSYTALGLSRNPAIGDTIAIETTSNGSAAVMIAGVSGVIQAGSTSNSYAVGTRRVAFGIWKGAKITARLAAPFAAPTNFYGSGWTFTGFDPEISGTTLNYVANTGATLAPAASAIATTSDALGISTKAVLAASASSIATVSAAPAIAAKAALLPANSNSPVTADSPAVTPKSTLAPAASASATVSDSPAPIGRSVMVPAASSIALTAANVAIAPRTTLAPANSQAVVTSDVPAIAARAALSPASSASATTSDLVTITPRWSLSPAASAIATVSDAPTIAYRMVLAPAASAILTTSASPVLATNVILAPAGSIATLTSAAVTISPRTALAPADSASATTAQAVLLATKAVLSPAASISATTADSIVISPRWTLIPAASAISTTSDAVSVSTKAILAPAGSILPLSSPISAVLTSGALNAAGSTLITASDALNIAFKAALSPAPSVILTTSDAALAAPLLAVSASSIALTSDVPAIASKYGLVPASSTASAASQNVLISTSAALIPAASTLLLVANAPSIAPKTTLSPSASASATTIDPVLIAARWNLTPAASTAATTSQSPSIATKAALQPAASTSATTSQVVSLGNIVALSPFASMMATTADSTALRLTLQPAASAIATTATSPVILTSYGLAPSASIISLTAGTPAIVPRASLSPAASSIATTADLVTIQPRTTLSPAASLLATTASVAAVQFKVTLQPDDSASAMDAETVFFDNDNTDLGIFFRIIS